MAQIGHLSPADRIARARQQSRLGLGKGAPPVFGAASVGEKPASSALLPASALAPKAPAVAAQVSAQTPIQARANPRAPLVVVNPYRQPAPTENVNERIRRTLKEARDARLAPKPAAVPADKLSEAAPEPMPAAQTSVAAAPEMPEPPVQVGEARVASAFVAAETAEPVFVDAVGQADDLVLEEAVVGHDAAGDVKSRMFGVDRRFQADDIDDAVVKCVISPPAVHELQDIEGPPLAAFSEAERPGILVAPADPVVQPGKSKPSFRDRLQAAVSAGIDFQAPENNMGDDDDGLGALQSYDQGEGAGDESAQPPARSAALTDAAEVPVRAKPRQTMRERLLAASEASSDIHIPEDAVASVSGFRSGSTESAVADTEEIVGTLSALKVYNGWAVGTLWTTEREEIRVTGESIAELHEGLEYSFKGRIVNHSVHGDGFAVASAMPVISPNDKAIEKYLVRSFVGIGEVKAEKYVKQTRESGGDEAVEVLRLKLLNEPWSLDLSSISPKATFADGEDPQSALKHLMVTRNLMLRLGAVKGLRENTAKSLAGHLIDGFNKERDTALKAQESRAAQEAGAEVDLALAASAGAGDIVMGTWSMLMLNPYEPIGKVPGYGFAMAELVASVALIPRDSSLRLGALVDYAVEQGCQRRGHTFLRQNEITEAIKCVDPTAAPQQALIYAIQQGLVVVDGKRVYTPELLAAEKSVALRLAALLQPSNSLTPRTFADVQRRLAKNPEKINPAFAGGFDVDQVNAVAGILLRKQRLHVLSGGPGTGKTAIMETLLSLLKSKKFAFCAPTGMAAKVLTARVSGYGYEASTCHSLLKGSEEEGFKVDENEPLDCDVLVVDESTMNGIVMASALLKALPEHAHLIILGDPGLPEKENLADSARAGQLPSISPGRFMQDLLLLPNVHHEHLTKTYRNTGGILEVVKETSEGKLKVVDRPSVKFSHGLSEALAGFPAVMQEYLDRVAADGIEKTFLVMPLRKGERDTPGWNCTYANHVLRQACNPHGERLPGTTLHLGDRIVVRKNMLIPQPKTSDLGSVRTMPNAPRSSEPVKFDWASLSQGIADRKTGKQAASSQGERAPDITSNREDEGEDMIKKRVVNGDKGTIVAYSMPSNQARLGSPRWVRLALDDGQVIDFPGSEMTSLQHAYAGTVHGAQGSEFKNVIMVVTPGTADFMNQNMLFTGLSRAQVSLSVHGDDRVLRKIAATPMPPRNSGVVERVKVGLQDIETETETKKQDEFESMEVRAGDHSNPYVST